MIRRWATASPALVRRFALGTCFVAGVPQALVSQAITGRLLASNPSRPLAGVVVTANRADDNVLVGRTLTGARGEFRLTVGTDSLVIRALRVGQRPVVLARVRLAVDEVFRIEQALPDEPIALSVVRTIATDRCQLRTADSDVVGALFFAARSTILASGAAVLDGAPRSAYRLVAEQYNARGVPVDSLWQEEIQLTEALQPFRSPPADSLLEAGWVTVQSDGGSVFRALDAEVLLDDRFLVRYCLQLADDSMARPGVVGVAFRPAEMRRGRPDVEGVLWLDRTSYALRELEFRYTGLDAIATGTNPGGVIEFAPLPSGVWFVSAWSLRTPLVGRRAELRSGVRPGAPPVVSERRVLVGRRELRAEVLWVEAAGQLQFMRPWPLVTTAADADAASPSNATTDSVPAFDPCWLRGRLLSAGGTPLGGVTLEAFDRPATGAETEVRLLDVTRTDANGRFRLCPAAGPRALLVRSTTSATAADSLIVGVMDASRPHAIVLMLGTSGFVVPPVHIDRMVGTVDTRFDAPTRRELAVASGSEESVALPAARAASDGDTARHATAPGADRDSAPTQRSTSARATSRAGWLLVVDRDSISIPFATVQVRGGDRRLTGADGRASLPGDVRGEIELDVRRIGYAPFVGRVAPSEGDAGYVVRLMRSEQTLAAVEVVAPRETPLSRTGFYDRAERVRRGAILGAFMTPEEVERRPFGHAGNLLSGMQYVWMGAGSRPTGRGGCEHQVLVDGLPFRGNLSQIPASEIMGIEAYPSTANAPVELIPVTDRGSCGIIAIWLGPRR